MTNYNRKSFNVAMGAAKISEENWERTFGKKLENPETLKTIPASPWKIAKQSPQPEGRPHDWYNVVRSYPRRPLESETWEHRDCTGPSGGFSKEEAEALVETLNGVSKKDTVPVSGVWIRTREEIDPIKLQGKPMVWTILEVLVEVDGTFRLIQTHRMADICQMISHITEPAGVRKAPEDVL